MNSLPIMQHAETHPHYMPKPRDPHADEAERIAKTINKMKVEDPKTGYGIYDNLVDKLVGHSLALAKQPEHDREPVEWTAPQRVVWRSAVRLPYNNRLDVINDRSIAKDIKAWAAINQGRWIVECPFPGCNGAQYASFLDRRFWCVDCHNKPIAGKWIAVIWPLIPNDVEKLISSRPTEAQHWVPGETSEDILEQNIRASRANVEKNNISIPMDSWGKTVLIDGVARPVLHYGTPEWDASQGVGNG